MVNYCFNCGSSLNHKYDDIEEFKIDPTNTWISQRHSNLIDCVRALASRINSLENENRGDDL